MPQKDTDEPNRPERFCADKERNAVNSALGGRMWPEQEMDRERKSLPARARALCARFAHDRKGATAVEFSLIAIPFFALLMAIIETALVLWCGQVLQTAVSNATRRIFTGELAAEFKANNIPANMQREELRKRICANIPGFFDCSKLQLDVRAFQSFSTPPAMPDLTKNGEVNSGDFVYQPSTSGDIVVVRAALAYQLYTSFIGPGLSNLSNHRRLIAAAAAFRNEPF